MRESGLMLTIKNNFLLTSGWGKLNYGSICKRFHLRAVAKRSFEGVLGSRVNFTSTEAKDAADFFEGKPTFGCGWHGCV